MGHSTAKAGREEEEEEEEEEGGVSREGWSQIQVAERRRRGWNR